MSLSVILSELAVDWSVDLATDSDTFDWILTVTRKYDDHWPPEVRQYVGLDPTRLAVAAMLEVVPGRVA